MFYRLAVWLLFPFFIYAQPDANFSGNPLSGNKPLLVAFTDLSNPGGNTIVFWFWDFGDGEASIQQNPVHSYRDAGLYSVSLTVRDNLGQVNSETKTNYISVTGPRANFSATPRGGVLSLTSNFTDLSTTTSGTITSWAWQFGDGASSSLLNPSHVYSNAGNYDVRLIVTSSIGQRDTLIRSAYIKSVSADFSGTPLQGVRPLTVSFTDESNPDSGPISGWLWNFGDGTTSTERHPVHIYNNS